RPLWAIRYPPFCLAANVFQRWDPYGYRLWPSRSIAHRYPLDAPRAVTLNSNADGFRSRREFESRDGRPRIVGLGDSMGCGEGVEEQARFPELLGAAEPAGRVDNLGMVGFGPDLMLRALETVGLDPPPAVVILAMFTDDPRRVAPPYQGVGFPLPRFALRD